MTCWYTENTTRVPHVCWEAGDLRGFPIQANLSWKLNIVAYFIHSRVLLHNYVSFILLEIFSNPGEPLTLLQFFFAFYVNSAKRLFWNAFATEHLNKCNRQVMNVEHKICFVLSVVLSAHFPACFKLNKCLCSLYACIFNTIFMLSLLLIERSDFI